MERVTGLGTWMSWFLAETEQEAMTGNTCCLAPWPARVLAPCSTGALAFVVTWNEVPLEAGITHWLP